MESMGKKPRRRRSFTPEFKAEIVELCQHGDRSVGQVAKDFDLTETAVREWVKQAERDAGHPQRRRLTSTEREELSQLRRENRGCTRTWRSSSGRRLSSRRRPGERVPVHRGGEAQQAQRQTGVRAAAGLPCRLLRRTARAPSRATGTTPSWPADPGSPRRLQGQLRRAAGPRRTAPPRPPASPQAGRPADAPGRARAGRRSGGRRPRSPTRPPRPGPT